MPWFSKNINGSLRGRILNVKIEIEIEFICGITKITGKILIKLSFSNSSVLFQWITLKK